MLLYMLLLPVSFRLHIACTWQDTIKQTESPDNNKLT